MKQRSQWRLREVDESIVDLLRQDLSFHPLVLRVLIARGIQTATAAQRYLTPRLVDLVSPQEMAGMSTACERIGRALRQREPITVFGDYDVDGVSSTALLGDFLRQCGGQIVVEVARRDEGYGFRSSQARRILGAGCSLLVLVDCGTSDHEAVELVRKTGVETVAFDHHRITRDHWPGLALVNPQRPDCGFPYKGLASVGLVFYFIAALRRHLEQHQQLAPDPRFFLDLVALGTIADVAPLDGINRILVARGLQQLSRTSRPGLRELLRLCNLEGRALCSEDVGWKLGPRLNAPGRLGDATVALHCLLTGDKEHGIQSARQCHTLNEQRKEIQEKILQLATEQARKQVEQGATFIVAAGEGWHPGVIGIIASKLVDLYGRPAAVITLEEDLGRGSARSTPGIDLMGLLGGVSDLMERFGGHYGAAGFTLENRQLLATFQQRLHEQTQPHLAKLGEPILEVDGILPLSEATMELCQQLQQLAPYGQANPEPLFITRGAQAHNVRVVGTEHVALELHQGAAVLPAIGFHLAPCAPAEGAHIDVAFIPEINDYQARHVRLRLVEIRSTGPGPAFDSAG